MYTNDVDEGLICNISKFANETKNASKVITTLDKDFLERDLG